MLNVTNIPAPRVPVVEPETGLISREWYRFFYNIFLLAGGGTNQISIEDLQVAPPSQDLTTLIAKMAEYLGPPYADQSGDFLATLDTAQLASMMAQFQTVVGDIQGAYLQPPIQVGTMSYQNSDNVYITGGYINGTTSGLTPGSIVFAGASGVLSQNNANLFWNDTNLRLGIGTSSPSYLLHLNQNGDAQAWISATNVGSNSAGIAFENQGQRNWQIWADRTNDALQFGNNSRATVNMVINSSGNVGIGTSTFNEVKTVVQGTQTGGAPQTSGTTQTYGLLRLKGTTFTSVLDFGTNGGNYNWIQATDSANLATNYSLVLNPNGGNVGIGTASPSVLVHAAAASDAKFYLESTTSGAALFNLYAPNSGLAAYNAITSNYGATNSWYLGGDGNIDTLLIKTAGSERLRVTSVGNVYAASGTTGMTNGFFYIPAAAGAPTGVPTTVAGRAPMYYDTTNNKFYVYNGAWKSVILL